MRPFETKPPKDYHTYSPPGYVSMFEQAHRNVEAAFAKGLMWGLALGVFASGVTMLLVARYAF